MVDEDEEDAVGEKVDDGVAISKYKDYVQYSQCMYILLKVF